MLTIGTMPILLKIVAKLDIKPAIETLKSVDIFADTDSAEGAIKQLSNEKIGVMAMEIIADLTPQLGKIADDLPLLIASYRGVSIEEANKLDAAEVINEIIHDEGVLTFFKRAFSKKIEQAH